MSSILLGGVSMLLYLSRPDIAVSGAVHRSLEDFMVEMTNVSGWRDYYKVIIDTETNSASFDRKNNHVISIPGFTKTLGQKLVILPTPVWVLDSEQKRFICFKSELPGLMENWWGVFAELLQ